MNSKTARWVLVLSSVASLMVALDALVVSTALGAIHSYLHASIDELEWTINAYALSFAVLLVPAAALGDRLGRRRMFAVGLGLFVLGSIACALSTNAGVLIASRAVQGSAAALVSPLSLALVSAAFPPERRGWAMGVYGGITGIAVLGGPVIGGAVTQGLAWQWVFWINVPIGLALTVAAVRIVPDVRHNTDAPRPDLLGGGVIAVAMGALVLGLVEGNAWGWTSGRVLAAWAVAVVGVAVFVWLITHHDAPVIDPALLRIPSFAWANAAQLLFNAAFGVGLLSRILWLQEHWGYSAVRTGLAVAVGPALVPVTSLLVTKLAPRAAPGRLIALGCLLFAAGGVWQAAALGERPAYATQMLGPWVVSGIAVGLALPQLTAAATASLPPHQSATGSGVVSMARQLGLVIGTSIMVGLLGNGVGALNRFQHTWYFLAAASVAAAVAALVMDAVRHPVAAQPSGDASATGVAAPVGR